MRVDLQDGQLRILFQVGPDRCRGNRVLATERDNELVPRQQRAHLLLDEGQRVAVGPGPEINGLERGDAVFEAQFAAEFLVPEFHVMRGLENGRRPAGCSAAIADGVFVGGGNQGDGRALEAAVVVFETEKIAFRSECVHACSVCGWWREWA